MVKKPTGGKEAFMNQINYNREMERIMFLPSNKGKHLFLHSTKEEFVAWVENIKEVQSLRKAWEAYVNLLKPYLYVAIVKNENFLRV